MQQFKTNISFLLSVSVLFLISCNESATNSKKSGKDTAQVVTIDDTTSMPAYDRALDPLIVAGLNAKLLQDSLGIKIFESWVEPGELAPLHRHPDHAAYVLQGGKVMLYSKDFPGAKRGCQLSLKQVRGG